MAYLPPSCEVAKCSDEHILYILFSLVFVKIFGSEKEKFYSLTSLEQENATIKL